MIAKKKKENKGIETIKDKELDIRVSIWKKKKEDWVRGTKRKRERERVNTNSSRLADIKFAFILYSVIYDTDLSRGMDVRARNCFLRVYVCTERERRRERENPRGLHDRSNKLNPTKERKRDE